MLYGWPCASAPTVETIGTSPSSSKAWSKPGAHRADLADEAQLGIDRRGLEQPPVLARDPDRDRLERVQGADQLAVDLADQHHADEVERLAIGDAQARP